MGEVRRLNRSLFLDHHSKLSFLLPKGVRELILLNGKHIWKYFCKWNFHCSYQLSPTFPLKDAFAMSVISYLQQIHLKKWIFHVSYQLAPTFPLKNEFSIAVLFSVISHIPSRKIILHVSYLPHSLSHYCVYNPQIEPFEPNMWSERSFIVSFLLRGIFS